MRKLFTLLVCLMFTSFYAYSQDAGIFQTYIVLNNGSGNQFYAGGINSDGGTTYDGTDFGIVSTFTLNGGEIKTFKNNGGDVTGATLSYRIYPDGSPSGSFTDLNLPFESNLTNPGDQRWQETSAGVDLIALAGTNGTFVLEVFWKASTNVGDKFDNNFGSNFTATFQVTTLPVELSNFTATKEENAVVLNWTTLSEENNAGFDVEKSVNGKDFEVIGTVEGAGNSVEKIDYDFTDENPTNGINYYRLKQVDFDGKFEYSEIVSVEFEGQVQATLFPNPATDKLTIRGDFQEMVNIRVFNPFGQVVYQNTQRIDNQTDIDLSELPAGNYFLHVVNDATQKVIFSNHFTKQ